MTTHHRTLRRATAVLVTLATAAALTACGADGHRPTARPCATTAGTSGDTTGAPPVLAGTAPLTPSASNARLAPHAVWRGAWATSPQPPATGNWSAEGFTDHTLRQTARVTAGGTHLRIELDNRYGTRPLRVAGATVARAAGPGAVQPDSVRPVTFDRGARTVTVPPGGTALADPTALPVAPFTRVAVTLRLAEPTGPATVHRNAVATSYRAPGDHLADTSGAAFEETGTATYYLSGIEVTGGRDAARRDGIVAFGDSITDGVASTRDADCRYPDLLAERLAAAGRPRAVLNHGIGGNKVTLDNGAHGEPAVIRFARDALTERGVATVVVLEGINDIGDPAAPDVSVDALTAGHRQLVRAARAKGLKVVGATLTPIKGSVYDTPVNEAKRDAFNTWVRTSGTYDAYVDFDRALADPADPDRMRAAYDSGDHLHPSDAGYRAMAEAIDLDAL